MRVKYMHLYSLFKPYPCHLFDKISTLYLSVIANVYSIANLFVMIFICSLLDVKIIGNLD